MKKASENVNCQRRRKSICFENLQFEKAGGKVSFFREFRENPVRIVLFFFLEVDKTGFHIGQNEGLAIGSLMEFAHDFQDGLWAVLHKVQEIGGILIEFPIFIQNLEGSRFHFVELVSIAIDIHPETIVRVDLLNKDWQTVLLEFTHVVLIGQVNEILRDVVVLDGVSVHVPDQGHDSHSRGSDAEM